MRPLFYKTSFIIFIIIGIVGYFYPGFLWAYVVVTPFFILGIYDVIQSRHTILRNFPVVGHLRYLFESISPEIQQYFVERRTDGVPFTRNQRSLAYTRAKGVNDTHPFGTELHILTPDYEGIRHSIFPCAVREEPPRVIVGNKACKRPYNASVLNISAMSFGALSKNAILALNKGAKVGGFYHNTGEGGLSPYHLAGGGDLVWQIGTAYFGCRTHDGDFDSGLFREKAQHEQVKMIELKLSQGAKPGHGGVLPAVKNSEEIASIRHIKPHTMVLSPPGHRAFADADGLIRFVDRLRSLSGGKPVGFKLCVGRTEEFLEICEAMVRADCYPDFITVDGAEGGTGAAPLEFSDSVGIPLEPALIFVRRTLDYYGIKKHIKIIASGKILSAASILKMKALGADMCNSARGFMFSLGCIQALRCNTNKCPTGVTTQDPKLVKGLVVEDKYKRVANFHLNTLRAVMELVAAAGKKSLDDVDVDIYIRGDEMVELQNRYIPDSILNRVQI